MVAILFSLAQMQSIHLVRCPRGMGREGGNASFYIHIHAFIIVWCTVYAKWEYHGIDIHITRDRDLLPSFSFASDRVRISSLVRYFSFSFFGSKIEFRKKVQDRRGYEVKIKIISIVEC